MEIQPLHTTVEKTIQIKNGNVVMESHSGFPAGNSNLYLLGANGGIIWKAEKPDPKTLFSKVKLNDDMTLSTFTISGQLSELSIETGKIISSTSFKIAAMIKGFLNLPWFAWAVLALLIAVIYFFLWPRQELTVTTGFRFLVIRWGHALTWLLISVNFILRGLDPKFSGTANLVAAAGGLMYLLFMTMTFVLK